MMFITETGMEKDSVYVILDIPKEMPKDWFNSEKCVGEEIIEIKKCK